MMKIKELLIKLQKEEIKVQVGPEEIKILSLLRTAESLDQKINMNTVPDRYYRCSPQLIIELREDELDNKRKLAQISKILKKITGCSYKELKNFKNSMYPHTSFKQIYRLF